MPYAIDETVVLTPFGRSAIARSPNSEHLMQRHEVQGLEIRAVRETDGRLEIAFKWIREFHPAWAFAGVGCESENMILSNDDGVVLATDPEAPVTEAPLRVVGLTDRGQAAGLELVGTGRLSFVRVDGGILVDDFTPSPDTVDLQHVYQERHWARQRRIANGTLDPATVLLAVVQPHMSLRTLAASKCAELRWVEPDEIMWASRKFGFELGTLIARTTYGNLADPIAAMKDGHGHGTVVDADLVVLPSFDSIEWDNPAGDDRMTLPQGAAMRRRPYADDGYDSLAA
jgi:hypothetical protein